MLAQKGADKLDHKWVVELCEDTTFNGECLLLLFLDRFSLVHALQSVAGLRLRRLHHLHDAKAATANDPQAGEGVKIHFRVLEGDAVLHIVEDRSFHHGHEGLLVDLPEFGILRDLDRGAPGLMEEESSLPDVVAHAEGAHMLSTDLDRQLAPVDDEELVACLPLGEDNTACCHAQDLQRVCQKVQVVAGERAEDDDLLERGLLVILQHRHLKGPHLLQRRPDRAMLQHRPLLQEISQGAGPPDGNLYRSLGVASRLNPQRPRGVFFTQRLIAHRVACDACERALLSGRTRTRKPGLCIYTATHAHHEVRVIMLELTSRGNLDNLAQFHDGVQLLHAHTHEEVVPCQHAQKAALQKRLLKLLSKDVLQRFPGQGEHLRRLLGQCGHVGMPVEKPRLSQHGKPLSGWKLVACSHD
mmetsp:Transcript_25472/g.73077  ORF Transcript_25472/g.73077 Transcript_25472/m.73077 type:complete len:414 (+) Transcript_25472:1105-2346(+)